MAKTTKKTATTVKKADVGASSSSSSRKAESKKSKITVGGFLSKYRRVIIIGSVVIIVAALAFLGKGLFIAATVNGQPISRFSIIQEVERQMGQNTLEREITKMLVHQEARKKNITASEEDINKEIKEISDQFKAQGQDLNELLSAQGIEQSNFREDIEMQILVQKILGDKVKITDKEIDAEIAHNKEMAGENAEEQSETPREAIKQQLEQQKLSQEYQSWITEIRKNANVLQFVEYK